MLNWDAIAAIGELIGAAGVIGSLIFVGVQMRSDRSARVDATLQARMEGSRNILLAQATNPELGDLLGNIYAKADMRLPGMAALENTYGLTTKEAYRVCCLWVALFRKYEGDLNLPLPEYERDQAISLIRLLNNGPPAAWWPEAKPWFSQKFIQLVEDLK
jgi:hypothetical protein